MRATGRVTGAGAAGSTRSLCRELTVATLVSASLLLCMQPAWGRGSKGPATEPDYTKGEKPANTNSPWNLGPTGASGNIWGTGGDEPTRNSRMIQIHSVATGTPADGVLQAGDVILGVISPAADGARKPDARFTRDCRKALGDAITEAEKKANRGRLVLNVWRKGKTFPATLDLPVKGTFSPTTPWECEKTKALIDAAAQAVLKGGLFGKSRSGSRTVQKGIDNTQGALGLLATGEEKYLPAVEEYARDIAKDSEQFDIYGDKGIGTWHGGYRNLFLTEYYLATKDRSVLPGITALSTYLALGQSGVGTWSHGMAAVKMNGLYGPPCAYGAMNSASVPVVISLMLAQKCGIKKKEIDDAVERSLKFYRWYVDKGCVPYGDHSPAQHHDNNGKNSMTAVMFDIAGEKKPADFFTRMTLASYNGREKGHTGNFFSWQWGALGAARGGPAAGQSFVQNTRWFTDSSGGPTEVTYTSFRSAGTLTSTRAGAPRVAGSCSTACSARRSTSQAKGGTVSRPSPVKT